MEGKRRREHELEAREYGFVLSKILEDDADRYMALRESSGERVAVLWNKVKREKASMLEEAERRFEADIKFLMARRIFGDE